MNFNFSNHYLNKNFQKISFQDLIIFLIPFTIFMFYLYIYDPGILRPDTFSQFHQIATSKFDNWHPFFHTFIDMLCLKVWSNPKSIAILQILIFSTIWAIICNYFRQDIKNNNMRIFIFQVIFTLIISLIPINGIFSVMILKDILFSYFLLFSCFLIYVLLDKKANVSFTFVIIFSLSMAFVAQIRPNGIYLIVILLIFLSIYLYKKDKLKNLYILIPALTIIFILLIASLNIVYDVEDNQKDAVMTKVIHMLADYDLNLDLSNGDRDKIHKLFNRSVIEHNYDITFSDPIYNVANKKVYDNDKSTYISMAIKYSLNNPFYFLKYIFGSSPMVWNIVRGDDWSGSAYRTDTDASRDFFIEKRDLSGLSDFESAPTVNKGTKTYNQVDSFVNYIQKNKLLDTLFNSPALYMYLSFILIGAIFLLTKSKNIFLVYLPNMLNILIIFASTPIQDVRYLYPNLLLFYFLVIILLGILVKSKLDDKSSFRGHDNFSDDLVKSKLDDKSSFREQKKNSSKKIDSLIDTYTLKKFEDEE